MILNIEEYNLTLTCTTLEIQNIGNRTKDTFEVFYALKRADGYVAEQGNKTLPIQALPLFVPPYNMPGINQMLSQWGITAVSDAEENNNPE